MKKINNQKNHKINNNNKMKIKKIQIQIKVEYIIKLPITKVIVGQCNQL